MLLLGSLVLFVPLGQFQAGTQFLVVASMLVDRILATNFIDHHSRAAVVLQRKVFFHQARAVAFLGAE